ncbi:MAG: UDP-4-amino-4,6-dideoxy-N-acetyl-beta-L-altrosamine transaminase [Lachnospiraceae bacterium]|nr:UDP-4-amino-4,6-dideoxy-N-acetyl-beta-L-altrosamine transaminase [Lachnospiraceae bacterium]MEE3460560.1 UDP-4-amino-4,6-dideoxy-N-acetyl-beta-L-altrosamine transaminase [Lachnospiraceae bacterium]
MDKPAIAGGRPVRTNKIFYGHQWIDEDDIKAVEDVLRSDYLTCGPQTEAAQRALCEYTGAKYAVLLNSDTSALHCACMAAGVGPGDEIITTPITFAASANCALYCGARPVFADIDPETYEIDPVSIESHISDKTKAVIAVDYTGALVDAAAIRKICDDHGLVFIEDAAHSIGSKYGGIKVGTLADMTCFSFHPVKTITAGEGGAVLTDNEELYKKVQLAHAHGITHDPAQMLDGPHEGPWVYEMISLGYNYRMTDIQAALLCSQLKKLDKFGHRRQEIVRKYDKAFSEYPELIIQKEYKESDSYRHLYILHLDLDKLSCTRREFFDAMSAEGVQCQIHYVPVYYFPYYQKLGYKKGICPNAEEYYKGIMSLPLYPKMSDGDVNDVISAVTRLVRYYRR